MVMSSSGKIYDTLYLLYLLLHKCMCMCMLLIFAPYFMSVYKVKECGLEPWLEMQKVLVMV